MIIIDGTMGEGGGQILRSSLGLSMVTGEPVRINNIRAGRPKPGLMRQHLTCVKAAAKVCGAQVRGAELRSTQLTFTPGQIRPGCYKFNIGSAGSTGLVFQTLLPALMQADGCSEVSITGGTHNPWAPPTDFLARTFAGAMNLIGVFLDVELQRYGFYPAGGGHVIFRVDPTGGDRFKLSLPRSSELNEVAAHAIVANLPERVADKELNRIASKLPLPYEDCHWQAVDSAGPGNAVMIEALRGGVLQVFSAYGARHKEGYIVADEAISQFAKWRDSHAAVDEHLADQLLIPLALAKGGEFVTTKPTLHTKTNIQVIREFLDVEITCEQIDDNLWRIAVQPGL